jgi:exodeoxyribonuclease V beta subunit
LAAPFPETVKVPGLSAARTTERVIVDAFPRGARAGTMLHTILEEHDFANRDPDALAALVRKKLAAFGYTNNGRGEDLEEMLVRGLDAMLDTPLPRPPGVQVPGSGTLDGGNELSLRSITRDRRIDELEFILPIAQDERRQITAKAIAEVFAEHASDAVPREYAEHIARLGFLPLRGFLRGFVDLVFEHEGLFYVVDYKSNHLGPTAADYTPPRLASAMTHASYFLQYYLYVTAVDRWLRIRMRGYDYERCFGGVFYLFARGMSPTHTRGTGVFVDRPSRAMVETLSEVLDHG